MTHGSLFSGIGGFDLAAEWMGWDNKFHCEINSFCQKILKYHFPNSIGYADITKTDFREWNGKIDIVSGGFPCQPYSLAGKRKGKEDERHLWPEMLRAIREIQPRWVVGENVFGLLNWNRGMVFHEVQIDLEAEGYECFPYVLPACAVNAPHRRDRVWIVAFNSSGHTSKQKNKEIGRRISESITKRVFQQENDKSNGFNYLSQSEGVNTNAECWRQQEQGGESVSRIGYNDFQSGWPQSEPLLCRGDDGLSNWVDRIKALGNAIVPQVAFEIFKAIEQTR